ncbi:MAG: Lrp/AsnC family transcriptional regulator [Planctomycetes bacterium]|nr:Lrp/AsnC family transcriptional regulator [Planctomycetota bacterium]
MIDGVDRKILEIMQEDGRVTNAEIARRIGMAPSAILERIRKLEDRGVIAGYTAKLNPSAIDKPLLAFVFVQAEERVWQTGTGEALAKIPEVQEVHHIAGEDCFLVKIRARDTASLGRLMRERFGAIDSIRSTRTTIVLETVKETTSLPVEATEREVKASA